MLLLLFQSAAVNQPTPSGKPYKRRTRGRPWNGPEVTEAPQPVDLPTTLRINALSLESRRLSNELAQLLIAEQQAKEARERRQKIADKIAQRIEASRAAEYQMLRASQAMAELAEIQALIVQIKRRIREIDIVFVAATLAAM